MYDNEVRKLIDTDSHSYPIISYLLQYKHVTIVDISETKGGV